MSEMVYHNLKIFPSSFDAIISGKKTFEIRRNDRNYKIGDVLVLKEWWNDKYLKRTIRKQITFIQSDWGIKTGYVVLGINVVGANNLF